jgi:putative ABC transport system ATP-binding protein
LSVPVYDLRGVSRSFSTGDRRVEAVRELDLLVGRGEHVSVTGPSGSGKTTLLQLLGALDRPTVGEVRFDGRDLATLGDRQLTGVRARRVGFVFQQFNLIPTLSARANVEAALRAGRRERRERALAGLADVGLADRAGHLPSQLSGGEQQRVALARALVNDPEVVLADEPTGNLDRAASDAVAGLLESLAGERTVIVVTHDGALAARAPRVVHLEDGAVAGDGPPLAAAALAGVELAVDDVGRAAAWFRQVLGVEPGEAIRFVARGAAVAGGAEGAGVTGGATGLCAWISVSDPLVGAQRLRAAGIEVDEAGRFTDPWGNRLGLT